MNWKTGQNRKFVRAILTLRTPKQAESFLRDLMTESEIEEFAKRLQAADMLTLNTPYSIIEKETGLSSTTVARVSKWLTAGNGGYKSVINKLHHRPSQVRRGLS